MIDVLKRREITVTEQNNAELKQKMGLDTDDLTPSGDVKLDILCSQWKQKQQSECSSINLQSESLPVVLIEALLLTKGMGKHASGLFCEFYVFLLFM